MLFLVRSHEFSELRNNDTGIAEILCPALNPFEGDIAVVVDSLKSGYHLFYGDITSAHDAVFNSSVRTHNAVLDLNILDVFTKVAHSSFGRFAVITVGMVHIPESSDLSAADFVKKGSETCSITVNAVSFNEKSNVIFLRDRDEFCESLSYIFIIDLAAGGRFKIAEYSYI